jgi:hypothetical protein
MAQREYSDIPEDDSSAFNNLNSMTDGFYYPLNELSGNFFDNAAHITKPLWQLIAWPFKKMFRAFDEWQHYR